MPTEFSIDAINDYFTHLNPLAAKIASDIDETRCTYEHIWNQLKPSEHNDIINETLIKPEVSLKYFDNFSSSSATSLSSSSMLSSKSLSESTSSLTGVLCAVSTSAALNKVLQSEKLKIKDFKTANAKLAMKLTSTHSQSQPSLNIKQFYGYDGKNLSTYANLKVGLKVVHDDTLGTYRDEHSLPFSYKTKSQINLRIFNGNDEEFIRQRQINHHQNPLRSGNANAVDKDKMDLRNIYTANNSSEPLAPATAENYKKLHLELANSLSSRIKTTTDEYNNNNKKQSIVCSKNKSDQANNQHNQSANGRTIGPIMFEKIDQSSKYERFYDEPLVGIGNKATLSQESTAELSLLKLISKNTSGFLSSTYSSSVSSPATAAAALPSTTSSLSAMALVTNRNAGQNNIINNVRNICYDDKYTDDNERSNLMTNCNNSSGLTLTSSSSAPSEDDTDDFNNRDDDDEKTLCCEDAKLLLEHNGLQKGFDFLNNW